MARRLIGLDFETHYDSKHYSLRKMDIPSYICDARFEATLVAVKEGSNPAFIVDGPDIPRYLQGLGDPRDITLYGHNLMFDACIASWRYGWRAGLNICTLALARQTIQAYCKSLSLKSVLEYLKLPAKGGFLSTVDGMRRADIIAAGLWQKYCEYAVGDIDGSYGIYQKLAPLVPPEEHVIADMVLRMATEPSFDLDQPLLQAHLEDVVTKKEEMLAFAMIGGSLRGKEDLMSNDKFAEVLIALGVDPPTKMSPVTGKQAWAFAKSDDGMKELQEHHDPVVQAVVAARLGHKTTLEETRTARFLNCSQLNFPAFGVGKFPVPLKVSGAHTHRLCLVGGTIICTLRDNRVVYSRLDELRPDDLVWDGEVFVAHGGLAYAGRKHVVTYDGITGTPDHRVWTLEFGYIALAEAAARGADIARGAVPDETRIDPHMQGRRETSRSSAVSLQQMRHCLLQPLERSPQSGSGVVQILRDGSQDARCKAISENAGGGDEVEYRKCREASTASGGVTYAGKTSHDARNDTFAVASSIKQMADRNVESGCNYVGPRASALHEPQHNALQVLRRERDRVRFYVDGSDGRLASNELGAEAFGSDIGQNKHERPLRTGQSSLGDERNSNEEPQLMETWDIVDCGPRNRFMANGRLVHNSGDWKFNAQNMRRGGKLRKSLKAPPGHTVVAGDEKQIEARTTAEFSGQHDLVEQFRLGVDTYAAMATKIFGFAVDRKIHVPQGFVGKTCLAANTLVLTSTGWKPIPYIATTDKLWDGMAWVTHDGVIFQGVKPTLMKYGVTATSDHEINTGNSWAAWHEVCADPHLFRSALRSATIPSSVTLTGEEGGTLSANARVGGAAGWTGTTSRAVNRLNVVAAWACSTKNNSLNTLTRSLIERIASGCATVFGLLSSAATIRNSVLTPVMADVALSSALSGARTSERSSDIFRQFRAGTTRPSTWTAKTTTKDMNPATFGSLPEQATTPTVAQYGSYSGGCTNLKPVYDIANAGPRRRFTILTDEGPLIVSNCVLSGMYGVGAPKFRGSVKHLSKEQTGTAIDVDVDLGPTVTSETIIDAYRRETWAITDMRKRLNNCIPLMAQPDCNFFIGPVQFLHEKILLPNGHFLYYHKLRYDALSGNWIYEYAGRWKRLYGGALLENIIQALARIVVMQAALRLRPDLNKYSWKLALQAHDELVLVVPTPHVDYAKHRLKEELTRQVTWMPNLPVDADVDAGPTYGDAK